jgi:hypothetical protein
VGCGRVNCGTFFVSVCIGVIWGGGGTLTRFSRLLLISISTCDTTGVRSGTNRIDLPYVLITFSSNKSCLLRVLLLKKYFRFRMRYISSLIYVFVCICLLVLTECRRRMGRKDLLHIFAVLGSNLALKNSQ